MASSVSPLPVELMIRILSLSSSFKDIVICSGVSRQFRDIVETSAILQYIIELGLCGLVESGPTRIPTAERLYRLRQREEAFSTLHWQSVSKIPVGRKYIFWDLCGGMFLGSYKAQQIFSRRPRAFDRIDIFDFYSRAKELADIVLEGFCCNFSFDPGQDLLILVEDPPLTPSVILPSIGILAEQGYRSYWVMHIRYLSGCGAFAHHRAAHEMIQVPVAHETWPTGETDPGAVETQILGTRILFSQRRGPGLTGSILIFDWTMGTMMLMIYPALGNWCCTLLSENELLVAQRPSFRSQPCLELYDIHPRSKWHAPRVTYSLPFGSSDKLWRPEICYHPASYTDTPGASTRTTRPFTPPSGPLLVAFRFVCPTTSGDREFPASLDMFLLPEKLIRKKNSDKGVSEVISWDVWGPRSTRWFKEVLPTSWRRNIQGYRAVLAEKNAVIDFNADLWAEGDDGVVSQPSHIPLSPLGHSNYIISSLPYRSVRPPQPFGCGSIMLDDDLVCVETEQGNVGTVKMFRLLSF